jgi:DMSO/TMAO reductase YedYZ molybdopterin-dependent catalytic subunit
MKYAWKEAKFVRSIEFSSEDRRGFLELRGYQQYCGSWTRGPLF